MKYTPPKIIKQNQYVAVQPNDVHFELGGGHTNTYYVANWPHKTHC